MSTQSRHDRHSQQYNAHDEHACRSRMRKSPCKTHSSQKKYTPTAQTLTAKLGRCAENLVIWYLKQRNWHIMARNYATKYGEIDIIAYKYGADLPNYNTIAFIEVKSRSSSQAISPQMNVTAAKQRKLASAIKYYISKMERQKAVYRCDVAAVTIERKKAPRIKYFSNAFWIKQEFGW